MSQLTDFAENALIDCLFRGQALGNPATWFLALYTAAPGETGGGTEVTGGSYTRPSLAASLANFAGTQGAGTTVASSGSSGQTSNNVVLTYPAPTANWGTITHFSWMSAVSAGSMWIYGALAAARVISNGDAAPSFAAGALTATAA
jgi:hypothetical protein